MNLIFICYKTIYNKYIILHYRISQGGFFMMLRILKYEIKSSYIRFIMAFLIYILIASVLMAFFRDYEIVNTSTFIFGIIGLSVITFLIIFQRYNTNIYGCEEYFMFTHHVERKSILISELILDLLFMFAVALIMVSVIVVIAFSYSDSSYINDARNFYEINKAYTTIYLIEYLLNMFRSALVIYFSICISKLQIWKRFSILAGVGTYFIIEIFNLIPLLFLKDVAKYAKTTAGFYVLVREHSINSLLIWYGMDLFIFVLLFYVGSRLLYNKTILK